MLKFPDDTQISLFGLDEIFAQVYAEGMKPNNETGEVIIERLEAMNNFIPLGENARREYRYLLLGEYRKYVKDQKKYQGGKI